MKKALEGIFANIEQDKGTKLNRLIELQIISMEKLINEVISSKNAKYMYLTAKYVKNARMEELAKGIIATQNADYIYKFACSIKDAPVEE